MSASPAEADFAPSGGLIGIVDTVPSSTSTQGATSVQPGATAQPLGSVLLAVPNEWSTGDSITLQLYDRGTTGTAPAKMTAATKLVINPTATPTVHVSAASGNPAGLVAPTFSIATDSSSRVPTSTDRDQVVLTATNTSAAGTGTFLIEVDELKVDTGADVTPGEIRVVPTALNACTAGPVLCLVTPPSPSPVFDGNKAGTINTYTVPGYVAPASIAVASPSGVVANGTTQQVGDVTIAELSPRGLQAGTYRLDIGGATLRNSAATPVTVTLPSHAAGESATTTATVTGNALEFQLTQTDLAQANAGKVSIVLRGVRLSATNDASITYALSGGSVTQYYAIAGQSPAITGASPAIAADSAFGSTGSHATQPGIVPPGVTATGKAIGANARIGGADRYATAAMAALQNDARHHNGSTAIVASGEAFPDALSAGFLSQRLSGASVLLTRAGSLPTATMSAMRQMKTTKVYVIGGTAVVNDAVVKALQTVVDANVTSGHGQITRIAGADRYTTNQAVDAEAIRLSADVGTTTVTYGQAAKRTALLASGEAFADALSAAPAIAGANNPIPLILTPGAALNQPARVQLGALGITQVIIVGGEAVVSPSVASELTAAGIAVKRLAGADRYGTAAKVADFERAAKTPASASVDGGLGFNGTEAFLASGAGYADALAGGPLAANQRSSILLTSSTALSAPASTWLSANKAGLSQVTALGLQASIPDAVLVAAVSAIS